MVEHLEPGDTVRFDDMVYTILPDELWFKVHGNSLEAGHWTKTSTEWYALSRIISNTALISWNYRTVKVNLPHEYCKAGSNEWKPMY